MNKTDLKLSQQLSSKDEKEVLKGIKALKSKGSSKFIPNIIQLVESNEGKVKDEALKILSELKDTSSAQVILDELKKSQNQVLIREIMNTMWNSSLDYSLNVADVVSLGLKSDYLGKFEALTIIENLKGPFEETDLLEAQLLITEYANFNKTDEAGEILVTLKNIIEDFLKTV